MRDKRFVAEHRGGPLKKEQHRQLMQWACVCARHILPLYGDKTDPLLEQALEIARKWQRGKATVGEARQAAFAAIAVARASINPVSVAVARAVGHAVATAHMADHALGPALYALKARQLAGQSIEAERNWQNAQLPTEIRELVMSARLAKEKAFKLLE
ncbi:MAG: hypothetical protein PHN44_10025 [Candidatus Marinimicrobia bacterium]|nr:hypothetical protein [Dehalococcoidia bacterium]MDD5062600.1 hypothetical protein [Candidatus Neomarinimicrobiota bacterium]